MGYWTWTDARVQPKQKQNHDYYAKDKIRYDGFAKIVCPDDTEIAEPRYTGYGIFGAYDAYELVVDWNKDDLPEIFDRLEKENAWGCQLGEVARAYAAGKSKTQINEIVCRGIAEGKLSPTYFEILKSRRTPAAPVILWIIITTSIVNQNAAIEQTTAFLALIFSSLSLIVQAQPLFPRQ